MDGDELALTQEFLGIMLGVQRSGITIALGLLQAAAVVDQRRGYVIICDRPGLEAAACGCYERVQAFTAAVAAQPCGALRGSSPESSKVAKSLSSASQTSLII